MRIHLRPPVEMAVLVTPREPKLTQPPAHRKLQQWCFVPADEELVAWIPGRLLLEAARNVTTVHVLLDGPLRMGIFPAKMPLGSQARQWAAVYLAAEERERRALRTLLRTRSTVQAAVTRLLQARAAGSLDNPARSPVGLQVT